MARRFEQSIINARQNSKAQEYQNSTQNLLSLGMSPPNSKRFVLHLNHFNCSKVSDGASCLVLLSENGLEKCGVKREDAVEILSVAGGEGDITRDPDDWTELSTTEIAARKALDQAGLSKEDLGLLELHDCFSITGLL